MLATSEYEEESLSLKIGYSPLGRITLSEVIKVE